MRDIVKGAVVSVLMGFGLLACGDESRKPLPTPTHTLTAAPTPASTHTATPVPSFTATHTPMPTPTRTPLPPGAYSPNGRYSITGTVNGEPATGTLTLLGGELIEPNLLEYSVLFDMGPLHGSGRAEFLTVSDKWTISVTVTTASQEEVGIGGRQRVWLGFGGLVFSDFMLDGGGYAVVFSGERG